MADPSGNILYYGDNLDVLRQHVPDESIDLVYLDPPFNSNATYSVLFGHADGTKSAAQIKAFDDTWTWDTSAAAAFQETVMAGGTVARALAAFQTLLGPSMMLAYLAMMAPRLVELRRVLKPTGSLYLHCDPTASHYLKLLLDAVFGPENFRSEIVWKRYGAHNDSKGYGRVHDVILFYSRGKSPYFEKQHQPYDAEYIAQRFRFADSDGRRWSEQNLASPNPRPNLTYPFTARNGETYDPPPNGWKYTLDRMQILDDDNRLHYPAKVGGRLRLKNYMDEMPGVPVQDLWSDVVAIGGTSPERLGYPTQKPVALLERIIRSSCPPKGIVLDPFCGCGTTVAAAEKLKRRWVGVDVTYLAISLVKSRLTLLGTDRYHVVGEPITTDDAAQLAADDPYQFQWWALSLVGARGVEQKKGADHGIDGRLFFFDEGADKPKQVIVSVKAGKVQVSHVRDLRGVLDRENAQIGVLLSLHPPTQPMRQEAASAGFYSSPWGQHPRMQIVTVADLLDGRKLDMPAGGAHMTQVALPPTPEAVNPDQLSLGT
ncbi:MAG: restriction endonuclease [Chloroflexi bacterium]|nr:restriction endonuclease [Chloroflexota bacterium]